MPLGLGVTGLSSNKQVAFAGRPEQLNVKLIAGVAKPYRIRGMTRFCPRVTVSDVGGGANPVTTMAKGLEFPDAKFVSPLYCATMEFGPAARDEVLIDVCPPEFSIPAPSEIPFAKNITVPDGLPEAALITAAESVTAC